MCHYPNHRNILWSASRHRHYILYWSQTQLKCRLSSGGRVSGFGRLELIAGPPSSAPSRSGEKAQGCRSLGPGDAQTTVARQEKTGWARRRLVQKIGDRVRRTEPRKESRYTMYRLPYEPAMTGQGALRPGIEIETAVWPLEPDAGRRCTQLKASR